MGSEVVCASAAVRRPWAVQWVYDRSTRSKIVSVALVGALPSLVLAATTLAVPSGTSRIAATVVAGLAAVVALAWAVSLSRGIEGGMRDVRAVALALADGDLTRASSYGSRCELGEMSAAMDDAVTSLRAVMREVVASADVLATSSEGLRASSREISAASRGTSTRAQAVSSAVGEVSRGMGTVAAGTEQMGAAILEISRSTDEAAAIAADAVREVAQTGATAVRLDESSRQIGEVVALITSIAGQTHLLALNAGIEAARAGEAGRGFAVVASAVKDLAQESARAAESVSRQVEGVRVDTGGVLEAVERIGAVVERIDGYQTSIASAVEEQTATTAEMVRSVGAVADASDEIAATVADVSAAAGATTRSLAGTDEVVETLAARAASLRGAVARFTF